MDPDVSIILIADYRVGEDKAWDDLRATVSGLAAQDYTGPADFWLVEERRFADAIPSDLVETLPSLKFFFTDDFLSSYEMKNLGVEAANADLVVLLDADCVPVPGWLSAFVAVMNTHPEVEAVSGRTLYPGSGFLDRAMGLLSRSYVDRQMAGPTTRISNNNAGFRREAYLKHPLPLDAGVFAASLQAVDMRPENGTLYFEPAMSVFHDYPGWELESDSRRYMGYGSIVTRLRDPRMPLAWLTRLRYLSIPLFFGARVLDVWWRAALHHRDYGVRTFQLPAVFALALVVHVMELPGMIRAYRSAGTGDTNYR